MKKMYIVKYYGGCSEHEYTTDVFVTEKISKAKKYRAKFNKILKKWKKYYSQFEEEKYGFRWIKDEHLDKFKRWTMIKEMGGCYIKEVEIR